MRLQYMRELLAIHEYGNFSKAANSLFMTQPALSRHIADMEKQLGVRLLSRDRHHVEFTEAGLKTCQKFRHILHTYDALQQELSDFQEGLSGSLRLGMLYYTIRQDFAPVLSKLMEQYPNVEIKQISCQPQDVYRALEENRIDIGVLPRADYPNSPQLRLQNFTCDRLNVMMSANHPLAQKSSVTFDDLEQAIHIQLQDDPYSNLAYNQALEKQGFRAIKTILTSNVDTVPFALMNTNAIYIKPANLIFPAYEQELPCRPIVADHLLVYKSYAYRADNENPLIPVFLELAKKYNTDLNHSS